MIMDRDKVVRILCRSNVSITETREIRNFIDGLESKIKSLENDSKCRCKTKGCSSEDQ